MIAVLAFIAPGWLSAGCHSTAGSGAEEQAPGIQAKVFAGSTLSNNDVVFGFESAALWSTSGATLGQSATHSQGSYSISVKPSNSNGYTPIASVPLSNLAAVSPILAVDVMLPTTQANPYWYGAFQMYLNCPSRGIYSQFLAQVELTGKPLNVWNTLSFPVNNTLVNSLLQSGYSDLVVTVVLNVAVPTTGIYYIDNLRFLPVTGNGCNGLPNGTLCNDNDACTLGETCQANVCKPASSVTCVALDQCHSAGTCSATTGQCSNPVKTNGTACDDGNICTQRDSCQDGICQGSGTCAPSFSATPDNTDFGSISLGATHDVELVVTNNGTAAGVPSFTIGGANPTEFRAVVHPDETQPCAPGTSLNPGQTCHISAEFAPLTPGSKSAVIQINGVTAVTMTGTALEGAYFSANPSTKDFGSLTLAEDHGIEVTVTNDGQVAGTPIFDIQGATPADFYVLPTEDGTSPCKSGITVVQPGQSCHIFAHFAPLTPGQKAAVIKIGNATLVTMTGTGLNGAYYSAAPSTFDFGSWTLGRSASVTVTVTNDGQVAGTPIFDIQGATPADFNVLPTEEGTNPCKSGTVVQPGQSCQIFAVFAPLTPGEKYAAIKVGNATLMTMSGAGLEDASFSAAPSIIHFGSVTLGGFASVELTVTNNGQVAAAPIFNIEGAADFNVLATDQETDPCKPGVSVEPGESCHAYVQFVPVTPGDKNAVLKIGNATVVTITGFVPDNP